MRLFIEGMNMPKHCGECKLKAVYDDETFCPFFTDNVEYWIAAGRRHEDCPLGYFPPHGRLIDADALGIAEHEERFVKRAELGNWMDEYIVGIVDGLHEAGRRIINAPTVIPAEESCE